MFEKEAIEYGDNYVKSNYMETVDETWRKGAEFGYNLAKEEIDYLNQHWGNGKDKANIFMNWILGWLENEKENRKEFEDAIKKGYLAYIYQSCATKSLYYGWKCVDPKYYTESEIEDFKKKYSVTGKLYDDFNELCYDLIKLNIKL